ncbi:MAG: TIGR04283 family arsenosugar biosynthesis glycosyltransferase [Alphaproteobacteria bacterium]
MRLSIIIPTLNEASFFAELPSWLRLKDPLLEIIIADGGSQDGSVDRARNLGLIVIECPRGRGQQLAAGAKAAKGEVLLFLHADTILDPKATNAIREALEPPAIIGGNFRLLFDGEDSFSSWLTSFYAWLRRHGYYYGDSAIFIRRDVFETIGGIKPIALMEDFDLVRRMERHGGTTSISDPPATTSSRRFHGRRPWRIVSQWMLLHVLFLLGASPEWLAKLYRSPIHSPSRGSQG